METKKSKGVVDRKIENETTQKETLPKNEQEREKKMSRAQKTVPILIVVCVSLGIILLATLIAFYQLKKDDEQNSRTLESVYASSYFTMVDSINNLQVDSSKFETLQNSSAQRKSLKDMEQDCTYILSGLSILPIEAENCMSATKFFNQIDGMCEAYINALDKGESLTQEQIALVGEMGYVLGTVKEQFNQHNSMVSKVGYSFIDASVFNSKGVNEFSNTLGDLRSSAIEYPNMIFDGPFSASLENKKVKGLSETEITKEQAEDYIKENVFYGYKNIKIKYLTETKGDFVTYDFSCETDGTEYDVQITKREGKLLTLSAYADSREPVLSKEDSIKLAQIFATRLGYENMRSVWWESKDNIAYINLAPIIEDVILYPDLVKVKVDLAGQKVIGFEGQNYCFNHVNRNLIPTIASSEAKEIVTGDFKILTTKLALIPLESEKEVLTYELKCEGIDGLYFFYVNTTTGEVEDIQKVVNQNGVTEVI